MTTRDAAGRAVVARGAEGAERAPRNSDTGATAPFKVQYGCGPCSSPLAAVDSDLRRFLRLAVTGRPPGRMAEHPFESCHVLFHTRAVRSAAARGRRSWLHRSHADSGAGDSCRPRRRRSAGWRADRNRQDRRIRPADAAAPFHAPVALRGWLAQAAACADPHADARAGRAGRSVHQDVRQVSEAHVDGAVRRRRAGDRRRHS